MKISEAIEALKKKMKFDGDVEILLEKSTNYSEPFFEFRQLAKTGNQYFSSVSKSSQKYLVIK